MQQRKRNQQGRYGASTFRAGSGYSDQQRGAPANIGDTMCQQAITQGMTWFGLGLGLAQLAVPGQMAKLIGLRDSDGSRLMMRLLGLREVAGAVALTAGVSPRLCMATRVGGDLTDLALLGSSLRQRNVNQTRIFGTMAAVLGATVVDLIGALDLSQKSGKPYSPASSDRLTPTTQTIVVNREPEDVYQFWANFDNFPRFMKHLEQVSTRKNGQSHWKARGPAGQTYAWDAEIVENRPNELITWRSLPGADVENEGSVRFERAPGGRGTLVRVNLRYAPPAGALGSTVAMLLGAEPGQEVQADLRRFKQVIETGEVVRSDASIHDRAHPARPREGTFRLPKPVPGSGPAPSAQPAPSDNRPGGDAWPEPDARPTRRAEIDDAPMTSAHGGSR